VFAGGGDGGEEVVFERHLRIDLSYLSSRNFLCCGVSLFPKKTC
jgi:hypothetical protein